MFGSSVGNLFKTSEKLLDVREGATYRHTGPGEFTETAKVVHVGPDAMGITHVRYRVRVASARERKANFEESRTLNIETFSDYFSETVDSATPVVRPLETETVDSATPVVRPLETEAVEVEIAAVPPLETEVARPAPAPPPESATKHPARAGNRG
jgi:hypothetical protein